MRRVFIIQNTPLNEPLPLSVYITGLLSNYKKNEDYEFNLIVSESSSIPKEIKSVFKKIYQFDLSTYSIMDNMKFSLKVYQTLKKENKSRKIDIVHCFYPNSSLLGAIPFKILNQPDCKIIYDIRSPWIEMSVERGHVKNLTSIYKSILYTEERLLCKKVDGFIFVTDGLKEHYKKTFGINLKNVLVSPSGVDLKVFKKVKTNIRKRYHISNDEILIGSVGGITNERKPWEILEVFAPVIKKNKRIKLMLIGGRDNNRKELQELAERLEISENLILIGNVPHKEIPKYISAFDWGLAQLPDNFVHKNNFSLKILEYLACGIPVLASNIKSNKEISKQLSGVFIYHNSEEASRVLIRKMKNFKIPENLRNYSWPQLTQRYYNLYDEIK